jgi:microcystin-dependent protein
MSTSSQVGTPYLGEIRIYCGNYPPRGWAFCNGQLFAISQYPKLYQLIGTTYGGDGRTTFAVPDLRGRFPTHQGSGPGLTPRTLGQRTGAERVTLTSTQVPAAEHTHTLMCKNQQGNAPSPGGNALAGDASGFTFDYSTSEPDSAMHASSIAPAGGGGGSVESHDNMPPLMGVSFIIALQGIIAARAAR